MTRITRYILIELLKVFVLTLAAITLLMILIGLMQHALRQGLGPIPILRLVPYVVPSALLFAVPAAILFAACNVYGRLSSSNEIVAIKSIGVSPMVAVWPALALAFVVSLVVVWLNDVAYSWGKLGIRRVVLQSVEEIAYVMLRTRRSYSSNRFSINVQRVEQRKLIRPTLVFHAAADSPPITFTAKEAELRFNPERNALRFLMVDGEVDWGDIQGVLPDRSEHEIPLGASPDRDENSLGPSELALRQIPEQRRKQEAEIRALKQRFAAVAGFEMLTGDFRELTGAAWQFRHLQLTQARTRQFRLQTEPWRRWANGFSCLFFTMVGAGLAIKLRTVDFWTTFGVCFLPILIVYYPFMMFGVDRAKSGEMPPYGVWLGNVILLLAGVWLLRRAIRY